MPQTVLLSPVDGVPQFAQANPDGIPNVYPGLYIIQVMRGFPRSYVESIKLGDTEVYDRPFDLWDGSQPIHDRKTPRPPAAGAIIAPGSGARRGNRTGNWRVPAHPAGAVFCGGA